MGSFHCSEEQLQHHHCTVCKETWPTKQNLSKDPARYVCQRCTRDTKSPKMYSAENDMDPGIVPAQLEWLTQIDRGNDNCKGVPYYECLYEKWWSGGTRDIFLTYLKIVHRLPSQDHIYLFWS